MMKMSLVGHLLKLNPENHSQLSADVTRETEKHYGKFLIPNVRKEG